MLLIYACLIRSLARLLIGEYYVGCSDVGTFVCVQDSAEVEKYSVYVQQYMNTFIILLADSGLQHQHLILNELVC